MTCGLRLNRLDSPVLFFSAFVLLSKCHKWSVARASLLACSVGHPSGFVVNAALMATSAIESLVVLPTVYTATIFGLISCVPLLSFSLHSC